MSRAADRRPRARPGAWLLPPAAESLYLRGQKTCCRFSSMAARTAQQIETAVRRWRMITG